MNMHISDHRPHIHGSSIIVYKTEQLGLTQIPERHRSSGRIEDVLQQAGYKAGPLVSEDQSHPRATMSSFFVIVSLCILALSACAEDTNKTTTTTTPPPNSMVKKDVTVDLKSSSSQVHVGAYPYNGFGGVGLGQGMGRGASNVLGGESAGYGKAFIIPVYNYGVSGLGYGLYGKGYGSPYGYSDVALGGQHPYGSTYYNYPYGSSYYHGPQGLAGRHANNY